MRGLAQQIGHVLVGCFGKAHQDLHVRVELLDEFLVLLIAPGGVQGGQLIGQRRGSFTQVGVELLETLRELPQFSALKVQGLMTLAIFSSDIARVRTCFQRLRTLRDQAQDTNPELIGRGSLSMGMSGDYEVAIEEGANCVRVGQAIFGKRALPDSYYWPENS